jgi:hypothetical protein
MWLQEFDKVQEPGALDAADGQEECPYARRRNG